VYPPVVVAPLHVCSAPPGCITNRLHTTVLYYCDNPGYYPTCSKPGGWRQVIQGAAGIGGVDMSRSGGCFSNGGFPRRCTTLPLVRMCGAAWNGKPSISFQVDDMVCRQFAQGQLGTTLSRQCAEHRASSASARLRCGAGRHWRGRINAGVGAAVGAGTGILVGTAAGARAWVHPAGRSVAYDVAFVQCMYARATGALVPAGFIELLPQHRTSHLPGATPPHPPQAASATLKGGTR